MNDLINTNKYDMVIENHRNSLETLRDSYCKN